MILIVNRKAAYYRRSAQERDDDPMEFQRRYMAGLAVQRRVTYGRRVLELIVRNIRQNRLDQSVPRLYVVNSKVNS